MKSTLFFLSLLLSVSLLFNSCQPCIDGHGPIVSEVRELDNFSKLELALNANVVVHVGEFPKISIRTHDDILSKIKTNVRANTLLIESGPCIGNVDELEIDLVVTDLNSINISGSGFVKTAKQTLLKSSNMEFEISGSGNIIANILSNSMDAKVNGSGDINVRGAAKSINVGINGSGNFNGLNLKVIDAVVDINGSGEAGLYSENSLSVNINGSGEVNYKGNPEIMINISGSGEVKNIGK